MRHYKLMTAAAQMPASCWGTYRRIAIVQIETADTVPKMISERAIGVVEIVATWEKLHVGKTTRCAYAKALKEANAMLADLQTRTVILTEAQIAILDRLIGDAMYLRRSDESIQDLLDLTMALGGSS